MAIPDNYIDKITKGNDSRMISPAADMVRVNNDNFDGETLDEVLDDVYTKSEVDTKVAEAGSGAVSVQQNADGSFSITVGNDTYVFDDFPTKQDMADAIDDALGEAQVTVVPENSVGIINSLGSDSDSDALSAAMGKKLKVALLQILSSLGSYAFPNGKPTLDFDDIVTFSVTKTIGTGLSATGGDTDVELGDSLEVSIAITDNLYIIDEDNIVVTMGGSPVAGAWNASTQKVTIASVTGNVVINVLSMTYISSGLVMNMDCKNTGGTAGHWKSIDGTYDFALTDVSVSESGAVFNGSSSKAVISNGASLNIGAGVGTVESVFTLGSPSVASPILVNPVDGNIGCACYPYGSSSKPRLSFRCATSASGQLKYAKQMDVTKTNYAVGINTERWYIDGMESSGAAEDGWLTIDGVTVLALGYRHRSSVDNYLNGTIKCVRVYNRKLTPSEMLQNYKVDKKRFNLS